MIRFEQVSKRFGNKMAVQDLTMTIDNGTVFGFIGPNGAGKTTTIKMLTGVLQPDNGKIFIGDVDVVKNPTQAKRLFGFVPDSFDMYERLTGMEYLRFMADIYQVSVADRKAHIEKYLSLFELEDASGQQIRSYSRGMKQKLAITGALIHNPSIWILDEPLVGLDPQSVYLLKEEMRKHSEKGNTVFFSTHVLDVAERLCDDIGIIRKGKLIAKDGLEGLRKGHEEETLEELFLQLTMEEGRA